MQSSPPFARKNALPPRGPGPDPRAHKNLGYVPHLPGSSATAGAANGRPIGGGVVFDTGELAKFFPTLQIVRYEEPMAVADFGQQRVRVVRYCARKP